MENRRPSSLPRLLGCVTIHLFWAFAREALTLQSGCYCPPSSLSRQKAKDLQASCRRRAEAENLDEIEQAKDSMIEAYYEDDVSSDKVLSWDGCQRPPTNGPARWGYKGKKRGQYRFGFLKLVKLDECVEERSADQDATQIGIWKIGLSCR